MFSTYDSALLRAKSLKRRLEDCGLIYPLNKCQHAMARAAGYEDWHGLKRTLDKGPRPVDPASFRRRLIETLPAACRPAAADWLDGERLAQASETAAPPRWYRDVFPFVMASVVLNQRDVGLLKPESMARQKLRARLVMDLLLNKAGGVKVYPRLDPESLTLVYDAPLERLYGDLVANPRFEAELEALTEAGVLDWTGKALLLRPFDREALEGEVIARQTTLVTFWANQGGASEGLLELLFDVLSALGLEHAQRFAKAISEQGSKAFTTKSGAILTYLTELAEEGRIEAIAKVFVLFSRIWPDNADFVRSALPAKVLNGYFARYRGHKATQLMRWTSRRADWAESLKAVADRPDAFAQLADDMAEDIADKAA